ncbi:hypothetical protein JTB14_006334 [Gonioctena quinquepunctata]|nr:hypothetical protein JTB14_006334 [Gonioctena quinquepunctata]
MNSYKSIEQRKGRDLIRRKQKWPNQEKNIRDENVQEFENQKKIPVMKMCKILTTSKPLIPLRTILVFSKRKVITRRKFFLKILSLRNMLTWACGQYY